MRTQHYNSPRKRLLSTILAVAMIMSFLPFSAFAAEGCTDYPLGKTSAVQINDKSGGTRYYDGKTEMPSKEGAHVAISKTVAATDTENVFDITLNVKTTYVVKPVKTTEDAATVLVFDLSGSMNRCAVCGNYKDGLKGYYPEPPCSCTEFVPRINVAKAAAQEFLKSYAASGLNGTEPASARWLAIVTFNTEGHRTLEWINVSDATDFASAKTAIGNMAAGKSNTYTNVEAGLILARNQYLESFFADETPREGITNRNVVLFTDGAPNRYYKGNFESDAVSSLTNTDLGEDTSTARDKAANRASQIKKGHNFNNKTTLSATLYAIAYANSNFEWMRDDVASPGKCYAANTADLDMVFQEIAKQIELQSKPWTVTDNMGECIDYDVTKKFKFVTYTPANMDASAKFEWDLLHETSFINHTGENDEWKNWREYELTYQVTLDTQGEGFVADEWIKTNGDTTLYYTVGEGSDLKDYTVKFAVPEVEGYDATFSFEKVGIDDTATALSGFGFTLTDTKDDTKTYSAIETNGTYTFSNIPSGHTYTLSETKIPSKYASTYAARTYHVDVSYGEVFIFDNASSKNVVAHVSGDCEKKPSFSFINPYASGTLKIVKEDGKRAGEAGLTEVGNGPFIVTVTFTAAKETYLNQIEPQFTPIDKKTGTDSVTEAPTLTFTGEIYLGEEGALTFTNVPTAVSYKVAETHPGGYYEAPSYSPADVDTTPVSMVAGENKVTIYNVNHLGPAFTVEKSLDNATTKDSFAPGETADFTIKVKNTGGIEITNLKLLDRINESENLQINDIKRVLPNGDGLEKWTDGKLTIVPDGEEVFKVSYTVTGDEPASSKNWVKATVEYNNDSNNPKSEESEAPFTVLTPNVTIAKTVGEKTQLTNGKYEAVYTLTLKNIGTADAHNVTVSDYLTYNDADGKAGYVLGKIFIDGAAGIEPTTEYNSFPKFTMAVGATVTITYTVTFNANIWEADELLSVKDQERLDAWLNASLAFEAADKAYQDTIELYEGAKADALANATDREAALAPLKEAFDLIDTDYKAAQRTLKNLETALDNKTKEYNEAMELYFEQLDLYENPPEPEEGEDPVVIPEPTMPSEEAYEAYVAEKEAEIVEAKTARDELQGPHDEALLVYNGAVAEYNEAITVDPENFFYPTENDGPYNLLAKKTAYEEASAAFVALDELKVNFDKLPSTHKYTNHATVSFEGQGGDKTWKPEEVSVMLPIPPETEPSLTIDKLVSVDDGKSWKRIGTFDDATGGIAQFKMIIRNTGLVAITLTEWKDIFEGIGDITNDLSCDKSFTGEIGVNDTYTFTWSYDLTNANVGNSSTLHKTNVFTVKYTEGEGDEAKEVVKEAEAVVIVPADKFPRINIQKQVKNADGNWAAESHLTSDAAQSFEFRFRLENTTGTGVAHVTLNDVYSFMKYNADSSLYEATGVTGSITSFTYENGTSVDGAIEVPAGGTVDVFATLPSVNPGEYIVNKVTADYDGEEDPSSEATVSVTPSPKAYFSVSKKVVVGTNEDGSEQLRDSYNIISDDAQTLTYKITVQNRGTVAGNVILTDVFDSTLEGKLYLGADTNRETPIPLTSTVSVPALGTTDLYFVVENAPVGTYKNVVTIVPENDRNEVLDPEDDATVIVNERGKAQLALTKQVRLAGTNDAFANSLSTRVSSSSGTANVEFLITVSNNGDVAAKILENALSDAMRSSLGANADEYITGGLSALAAAFTLNGHAKQEFIVTATLPVGSFTNTVTLGADGVEPLNPDTDSIIWPTGSENGLTDSADVTVTYTRGGGGWNPPGGGTEVNVPDPETPLGPQIPPSEPEVDLGENETPLGAQEPAAEPEPEELIVADENVPLGNLPQTSSSNTAGIMAALLGALGFLGLGGQVRRKENDKI